MNKQIEDMAKIICTPTSNKGNCEKCGFKKHCSNFDDATDLYNAGYRKASEVAREIFEEIENNAFSYGVNFVISKETLAEIKKKYEVK